MILTILLTVYGLKNIETDRRYYYQYYQSRTSPFQENSQNSELPHAPKVHQTERICFSKLLSADSAYRCFLSHVVVTT